jgi:hypothetical protein
MMTFIFVGPTLPADEIARTQGFVFLPPVAQGDLYRAARLRPRAIGVIDGFFSGAPSVWHKEILWAISQGVPVFGSASMGALRAAELHAFGMRGVGRIFEAFRDGALEDDDEVAVVHGPAELDYVAASEAMVNIGATLARAEVEGVVSPASRRALDAFAKSLFFPQRSWEALLAGAAAQGVAESEQAALRDWLPRGRVDQKRLDALEMLAAMGEAPNQSEHAGPKFNFEWTVFWDEFVQRSDAVSEKAGSSLQQRILDELRLEGPEAYARVEAMALLRMVAASGAARPVTALPREDLQATLTDLRTRLGLFARADLDRWMARHDLDAVSLERLLADETSVKNLRDRSRGALEPFLLDELRLGGAYERLAERARKKSDALGAFEASPNNGFPQSPAIALRLWFFERCLRRPMPDDVEDSARRLGFANAAAFDAALQRERLFLEILQRAEKA